MNLRLKMRVLESGKSQSQLSRDANMADVSFSRIVRGWVTPKEETKARIASALGCSVEEIF